MKIQKMRNMVPFLIPCRIWRQELAFVVFYPHSQATQEWRPGNELKASNQSSY